MYCQTGDEMCDATLTWCEKYHNTPKIQFILIYSPPSPSVYYITTPSIAFMTSLNWEWSILAFYGTGNFGIEDFSFTDKDALERSSKAYT